MKKSQGRHVRPVANVEKQRHVVHHNQIQMVLTAITINI